VFSGSTLLEDLQTQKSIQNFKVEDKHTNKEETIEKANNDLTKSKIALKKDAHLTEQGKEVSNPKIDKEIAPKIFSAPKDQQLLKVNKTLKHQSNEKEIRNLQTCPSRHKEACENGATGIRNTNNTSNPEKTDQNPKEIQNETSSDATLTTVTEKSKELENNFSEKSRKDLSINQVGKTSNLEAQTIDAVSNSVNLMKTGNKSQTDSNVKNLPDSIPNGVTESKPQLFVHQEDKSELNKQNTSPYLKSLLSQKQPLKYSQISNPSGEANHNYQESPMQQEPSVANQESSTLVKGQNIDSHLSQNNSLFHHSQPGPGPNFLANPPHLPYGSHIPQPIPQNPLSVHQQFYYPEFQHNATNQMHHLQPLHNSMWNNFNPAASIFSAPNSFVSSQSIGADKQHHSSHLVNPNNYSEQMGNYSQQSPAIPEGHHNFAQSAGCLDKLQQLTKGFKSGDTTPSASQLKIKSKSTGASSKQVTKNAKKLAEKAATEQTVGNIHSSYSYTTLGQTSNDPAIHSNSSLPGVNNTESVTPSYFDMSHSSTPSVSSQQLMHQYSQNAAEHHMFNYTNGYGFMNQYMYHHDHHKSIPSTPQPGAYGASTEPHQMYLGYPHHGYQTNYNS